ncbi:hypothetical protein K440DRAFT_614443 [Wilcoxina mikolae CBS 423.85]|nr:hypothetical protein K440DRAFT_614443 [Wilcoxina mikolae CBS 423.85]
MCIRITEIYAVCKCTYYIHGVDPCQSVGQHGHHIQSKTVLVGYACTEHTPSDHPSARPLISSPPRIGILPDSLGTSSSVESF